MRLLEMVTRLQLWYGFVDVRRLWEGSFFEGVVTRPGWKGVVLLRFFGRGVLFVYPLDKDSTVTSKARVL